MYRSRTPYPERPVPGRTGIGSKAGRVFFILGFSLAILVPFFGLLWLVARSGFGFLASPMCLVGLGILQFRANRRDRNKRMTGVFLIFLGVAWAAINILDLVRNGGK
jgi:hypothetical protein